MNGDKFCSSIGDEYWTDKIKIQRIKIDKHCDEVGEVGNNYHPSDTKYSTARPHRLVVKISQDSPSRK